MSLSQFAYRFLVTNALTLYYGIIALVIIALNYIKSPLSGPWKQKLRLEPPAPLTDPKYGVHKYLKVNNTKLHYVESGDPSKPLMLFVHGFPEFWYSWRHQIVEFNKDYWCVAMDMRGYGDSEKPGGVSSYAIDLLVEDVRDLIRQLGRDKCILVSHDWGGLVASRVREVHPDVISALIMLGSTSSAAWSTEVWNNPEQRKMSWYVFFYRLPILPELLLLLNDLQMYDKFMIVPGASTTDKQDIECFKYWFGKPSALTPPINYYRANCGVVTEFSIYKENVPMLVVHAAKDPFISSTVLDVMKKQYEHIETIILEDTGHFLQQENPIKVNNTIRDFLAKHKL